MSGRVKALAEKGEVRAALAKGESFVKGNPPGVEQVHFVLSQIYLETGDAAKALQHMELANSGSAPMVQGERLDARPEGPAPTGSVSAGTGGAEARITPGGGVEARAGGVTARVPD
jgi:hypothetical protein